MLLDFTYNMYNERKFNRKGWQEMEKEILKEIIDECLECVE